MPVVPTISTPGRIPVINFGDDADYDSILTVLDNLDVCWQITVDNSDLSIPIPNDFLTGTVKRGVDSVIVTLWETDVEIEVPLDQIICFTYL